MTKPTPDPVIDEIRAIRQSISARLGHDPAQVVEYYRKLQEQYADRLLKHPEDSKSQANQQ